VGDRMFSMPREKGGEVVTGKIIIHGFSKERVLEQKCFKQAKTEIRSRPNG